jgi:spore coat protein CotH
VYINGEYWGVYFLEEKRNESFIAQHEGVEDPKAINVLSGSGLNYVLNGTNEGYKELYQFITTHDMSVKENYEYLAERLDTDSYMDLMVNQVYVANSDYYNLQFYQVPGGKWKQIFYDMCWAFREPDHNTLAARMKPETGGSSMFNALLAYEPWEKAFAERFAWTMENLYTTDRFVSVIDEVAASVAAEMPAERAKFTDYKRDWDKEVESMRTFAKERPYHVLSQIKSVLGVSGSTLRGYFSFTDEQMKTGFNLSDEQMQNLFG